MGFTTFNILEGLFWIILGFIAAAAYFKVDAKYKKLAFAATVVLILFGISDFVEIFIEKSFLDSILWLYIWKIAGVVGIAAVIIGYIKLRIS